MSNERKAKIMWWAGEQYFGCTEGVYRTGDYRSSTCGKKAKYDPDAEGNPSKCGVHREEAVAARRAKSAARLEAKMQEWRDKSNAQKRAAELRGEAEDIIRKIAAGHNDPRSLAVEWVKRRDGDA